MGTVNNCRAFALLVAETLAGFYLTIILDAFVPESLALLAAGWNTGWAVNNCGAFSLLVAKALASVTESLLLDTSITE